MRWLSLIFALAFAAPACAQVGFDRPGNDYAHFVVTSGDPAVCAARCEGESRCRAWSFHYPTTPNESATCDIKSKVPPRVKSAFFISGVRGQGIIEVPGFDIEYSTDRHGGDYRDFTTPAEAVGESCQAACEADSKCRAWTYLRPGYPGTGPRCFLKNRVTPPRREPCCVSGVVR